MDVLDLCRDPALTPPNQDLGQVGRFEVSARLRRSVGLDERDGLLVRGVVEDSPAAAAGIREGDLLTKAGDRDLQVPDDLFAVLGTVEAGGQLEVALVRGAAALTVTVTF